MLELAYKYANEINLKYIECVDKPEYKHYNRNGYMDYSIEIDKDSWNKIQYASTKLTMSGDTEVIGFFEATKIIAINAATLNVVHFGFENKNFRNSVIFGSDLKKFIDLILDYKKLNKIEIRCRASNPALSKYFKLIPKIGGRYIGMRIDDCKDEDGELVNVHEFEITRASYMKFKIKREHKTLLANSSIHQGYFRKDFYEDMKQRGNELVDTDNNPAGIKPPIGIMPEWAWDGKRVELINSAIERYNEVNWPIPEHWISELNRLNDRLYKK